MRRSLLLLLVLMLGFGCISEKSFVGQGTESVAGSQGTDLDSDGSPDYMVYSFAPVDVSGTGMKAQRMVTVSVNTEGSYTAVDPNLTDVDLLLADQSLEEFSSARISADTACSQAIGLSNVVCSDVTTCARLCSAASQKCRNIAALSDEALAGAMIGYVQDNNQIRTLILDARRSVLDLRTASDEQRDGFLNDLKDIVEEIADINANPLYNSPDLLLCEHADFGADLLVDAAKKVGAYDTKNTSYHYRVVISVKPAAQPGGEPGAEVSGVSIRDKLSRSLVTKSGGEISSLQSIAVSEDAANVNVDWSSPKTVKDGYILFYEFVSDKPPEELVGQLGKPEIKVREINLALLSPTNALIIALNGATGNYFVAFGAAFAITLAILLVIYNIAILVLAILSEKAGGASITTGFRKAFGRTDVRWKTDIVIAILFLGAGYFVSTSMAAQPAQIPPLLQSLDLLLKSQFGIVGIGLTFIGVIMAYFAIENLTKIIILERAYGMVIKQEKDMFLARAAALKDKIAELEKLIEAYTQEDFDVSKEYDILASVKAEKIDTVSKEMTARTKTIIDEQLNRVDNAISSLKERKKISDENWPKWKEGIGKMLAEQNEVYVSALVTVPSSLRTWALGRYVKEEGGEGVVFDRDSLKKKKVSPEQLVKELIERGLIKGAIVMKQDKIVISEFAEGGGSVMSALALKLNAYLGSLAKNLGQHAPQSFVSVGDKGVFVLLKGRGVDSAILVSKDKFKDAMDSWKAKMKVFESA